MYVFPQLVNREMFVLLHCESKKSAKHFCNNFCQFAAIFTVLLLYWSEMICIHFLPHLNLCFHLTLLIWVHSTLSPIFCMNLIDGRERMRVGNGMKVNIIVIIVSGECCKGYRILEYMFVVEVLVVLWLK